jgi:3-oxoadipate enol-lactonase
MTADTAVELHHLLEGPEDAAREAPKGVECLVLCRTLARFVPPEGYAGCCEAIRDADLRDRLVAVGVPKLAVAGADDPAAPSEHGGLIRDPLPDAQLAIAPQARHLANVEQPEEITRAVLAYLGPLTERQESL